MPRGGEFVSFFRQSCPRGGDFDGKNLWPRVSPGDGKRSN